MKHYPITSEVVALGHPDKVADYISDSVLDSCLAIDPKSRVACEVLVTNGQVVLAGEITTQAKLDYKKIVRDAVSEIGYSNLTPSFNPKKIKITNLITKQSPDIALGLTDIDNQGAGDQGIVYGYAINDNDKFLPKTFVLARNIIDILRKKTISGEIKGFLHDAKCQVTFDIDQDNKEYISAVVVSVHHLKSLSVGDVRSIIKQEILSVALPKELITDATQYYINYTGSFTVGGPEADTGLTGRKIIVDTYGGFAKHGGGAFSGKDSTKLDRSGAYMARYLAKNLVASKICSECEIQIGYAIAKRDPVSLNINCFGTNQIDEKLISKFILENFDLSSSGIRKRFALDKPIYRRATMQGHFFGNNPWEQLDDVFTKLKR